MQVVEATPALKSDQVLHQYLQACLAHPFSTAAKEQLLAVRRGRATLTRTQTILPDLFVKVQGCFLFALAIRQGAGRSPFQLSGWKDLAQPVTLVFEGGTCYKHYPLQWAPDFDKLLTLFRGRPAAAVPLPGGGIPSPPPVPSSSPLIDQKILMQCLRELSAAQSRLIMQEAFMKKLAEDPQGVMKGLGKEYPFSFLFILLSGLPLTYLRQTMQTFVQDLPDGLVAQVQGQETNLKQYLQRGDLSDAALFERIHFLLHLYEQEDASFVQALIRDAFLYSVEGALMEERIREEVQRMFRETLVHQYGVRLPLLHGYLERMS